MSNIKLEECMVVEKGRYEINTVDMIIINLKTAMCTQTLSKGVIEDIFAGITGIDEMIFDQPYPPT
ncbi:hypothetical protein ACFL02_07185 [Planctomycetota bacterium]